MVKLSILILNYKTKDSTLACLRSLAFFYKRELDRGGFEIIVGDNGSFDGSLQALKEYAREYKNIKIIDNKENLGFAKGHNALSRKAKGEHLLFLNSDTQLKDRGLIGMVSFIDNHLSLGILGGRLVNPDGSNQPSSGKFYNLFNLSLMFLGGERLGLLRESPAISKRVDWVSGGSMMIRKYLFGKMNGFDEHFFMYFEDMELCFRANRLGFSTYFYPDVEIVHRELGSSNKTFAIINIYKGILYFYKKHKSFWQYFLVRMLLFTKAIVAIFVGVFTRNLYLTKTYREAIRILL